MIYLDNAATTLQKPEAVLQAVTQAMTSFGNCSRGAHAGALQAAGTVYEARAEIAKLFGCSRPDHTVFTLNATEALNTAINGLISPGDHVITTDLEHNSVLRPLYRLEKEQEVSLSFLRADAQGRVDYQQLPALLKSNTKAIVCTHASNLTGNTLDLVQIGAFARAHKLLFIVDASQSAGILPINMETMNIDVVCFTGHKSLYGPQGTGGLCIRPGIEIRPLKMGGSGIKSFEKLQPRELPAALEAGTLNGHGIAGLLAGVRFLREQGLEKIYDHEYRLMMQFYTGVCQIPGVTVYGDFTASCRTPVVALNIREYDSAVVSDELEYSYGIATRPGAHCAPRLHRRLGTENQGAVRFSFSWFNTEQEIAAAIQAVRELANE